MREFIDKVRKSPRGSALLFFAFYALFFTILIITIRSSNGSARLAEPVTEKSYPFETTMLHTDNYYFIYTVSIDKVKHEYRGYHSLSGEEFTFEDKNYFFNGYQYFLTDENSLETKDPYLFGKFRDSNKILSLLDTAYFEYQTFYESGKALYSYLIDTNVIYKVIEGQDTDYAGEENSMLFSTNKNGEIESIVFQLDDYCKTTSSCQESLKIEIEYVEKV